MSQPQVPPVSASTVRNRVSVDFSSPVSSLLDALLALVERADGLKKRADELGQKRR